MDSTIRKSFTAEVFSIGIYRTVYTPSRLLHDILHIFALSRTGKATTSNTRYTTNSCQRDSDKHSSCFVITQPSIKRAPLQTCQTLFGVQSSHRCHGVCLRQHKISKRQNQDVHRILGNTSYKAHIHLIIIIIFFFFSNGIPLGSGFYCFRWKSEQMLITGQLVWDPGKPCQCSLIWSGPKMSCSQPPKIPSRSIIQRVNTGVQEQRITEKELLLPKEPEAV